MDAGARAGFDSFVAANLVGASGTVVGVDMTDEMLAKSRATARELGLGNVELRKGLAEQLPVEDSWADVVISNGVINLCSDKRRVFAEIYRVLRPGGRLTRSPKRLGPSSNSRTMSSVQRSPTVERAERRARDR